MEKKKISPVGFFVFFIDENSPSVSVNGKESTLVLYFFYGNASSTFSLKRRRQKQDLNYIFAKDGFFDFLQVCFCQNIESKT